MTLSAPPPTSEEQEQLQQTIEMFEVIVQASPQDCQSLEILRDAYARLGKSADALGVARRLADTYRSLNQYSLALQEYEAILALEPHNMEVMAAVGELEEMVQKLSTTGTLPGEMPGLGGPLDLDDLPEVEIEPSTLMVTAQTQQPEGAAKRGSGTGDSVEGGNEILGKFLIQHKLVPEDTVVAAFDRVTRKNNQRKPNALAASLVEEVCREGGLDQEVLLAFLLDRSKFAYIPLDYYEVDRAVVKMLPEEVALARLIVPFDIMSRTLMVAMANPFDAHGKELVQRTMDYTIQWHLASPHAVMRVLAETYRLPNPGGIVSSEMRLQY